MNISEVGICNMALMRLGHTTISSFEEPTPEGQLCNGLYAPTRDEILEAAPWLFALQRNPLARLQEVAPKPWAYVYQKPADCLRAVEIERLNGRGEPVMFAIEGEKILTDQAKAILLFVRAIQDPIFFPTQFVSAVAWSLAKELAIPLTEDPAKAQHCAMQSQILVQKVWTSQVNQYPAQPITPRTPPWLAARFS